MISPDEKGESRPPTVTQGKKSRNPFRVKRRIFTPKENHFSAKQKAELLINKKKRK